MSGKTTRASVWMMGVLILVTLLGSGAFWAQSRRVPAGPTIAFIPQTAGPMLWEVEHFGATTAAEKLKCHLYWNAPTSENDMAGQVSLIDKVSRGKYQGLVLAPNHTLGIRAPVSRALAAGLPVVIVSAQLDLPASDKLGYIVNDDEKMGELAAAEIARLINGKGSIALVGIARYAPGIMSRVRGAERVSGGPVSRYPRGKPDSRNLRHLPRRRAHQRRGGCASGVERHIEFYRRCHARRSCSFTSRSLQAIRLVGCEQDSDLIGYVGTGEIAAVLAENTYRMGYEAVGLIADSLAGKPLPARSVVAPLLITKQNFNSAEASLFTSFPR